MRSKASTPSSGQDALAHGRTDRRLETGRFGRRDLVASRRRQRRRSADATHREGLDGDDLVALFVGDRDVECGQIGCRTPCAAGRGSPVPQGEAHATGPGRRRRARRTCHRRSRRSTPGRCQWPRPSAPGAARDRSRARTGRGAGITAVTSGLSVAVGDRSQASPSGSEGHERLVRVAVEGLHPQPAPVPDGGEGRASGRARGRGRRGEPPAVTWGGSLAVAVRGDRTRYGGRSSPSTSVRRPRRPRTGRGSRRR